jgi:hypothetical protein
MPSLVLRQHFGFQLLKCSLARLQPTPVEHPLRSITMGRFLATEMVDFFDKNDEMVSFVNGG